MFGELVRLGFFRDGTKHGAGETETEIAYHHAIRFGIPTAGSEVATDHNAVQAGIQRVRLQIAQVDFATAGGADQSPRQNEAENRKRPQNFQRRKRFVIFKRRAFNRIQNIERYGIDVEFFQRERHFDALFVRFAQAENPARADANTDVLRRFQGRQFIFEGMRLANVRKMARSRFDIGMVTGDPDVFELLQLVFGDESERASDFDAHFLTDAFERAHDAFKFARIALVASAGDDGKTHRAGLFGFFRRFDQ